ncbi:MAG TPA: hypothetical protein VMD29_12100 [Terracidiphilus sp.]|nr:hypothetical protein [Terracidiphilus sp.]
MNRLNAGAGALLALTMAVPFAAGRQQQPKQESKKVEGAGCVEAGVEAGCLVLKDIRSGKTFNLIVSEPRPHAGEGIEFTGTLFDGVTTCMQGRAVQVASWEHKDTLKCAPGAKK